MEIKIFKKKYLSGEISFEKSETNQAEWHVSAVP